MIHVDICGWSNTVLDREDSQFSPYAKALRWGHEWDV